MSNSQVVIEKVVLPNEQTLYPIKFPSRQYKELIPVLHSSIEHLFAQFGGGTALLKNRPNVIIKINGIDSNSYCYTRPSVLEATIRYLQEKGAKTIYVVENSTQGNYTRIVFGAVGYDKVCKRTSAIPIYLDEHPSKRLPFRKQATNQEENKENYELLSFGLPDFLSKYLIEERATTFYLNIPKLKTHSMSGVTLGIKNQWGFPIHQDRGIDHNFNLHNKLIDVLEYIRPDFTLIDGIEGTVHGHYPVKAFGLQMVKPFRVLVGGTNIVATDLVGAHLFGLTPKEVPHLRIALERNLGEGVKQLSDVEIIGEIPFKNTKFPTDLIQEFPPDVKIISGKEMWCPEGCKNNPLTLLQVLYKDYGGKGGFTMVAGKGFQQEEIKQIQGKVLIVGHCAIEEVGDDLLSRLGKKNVYLSGECNNLVDTTSALLHLMHVNPVKLIPINPIKGIWLYLQAKMAKSNSRVPSLFAHMIKKV
ncbi:MAG: DUF362 domain-containing protein [Promethearchaeota archaeon]